MLKIPKNVMQIGTGSPNVKLYMEDYVHTFLERCQGKETCLAFGQQEEKRKPPSGSGPCGEKKSRSEAILFFMNKTKKCRHI